MRNNDCQEFNVIVYGDGPIEITQDDDFVLLRTKKDVQRLIEELQFYLEW